MYPVCRNISDITSIACQYPDDNECCIHKMKEKAIEAYDLISGSFTVLRQIW